MDGVRVVNVPSFPADYSKPVPLAVGSLDSSQGPVIGQKFSGQKFCEKTLIILEKMNEQTK